MSVLVYIENTEGKFKKSAFEIISYAKAIADELKLPMCALSVGQVSDEELTKLSHYGAARILKAEGPELSKMSVQAYTSAICQASLAESAGLVIMSASFSGKAIAPRLAVKLNASLGENVIDLPRMNTGFVIKKNAYSGKAFAFVELLSEKKVISLVPNSYKVVENPVQASIVPFKTQIEAGDLRLVVKESIRSTDKVSLPDAELVVSAGRGMKGPENWKMIEELAEVLGAATACSKPVSDAGWRPHSEHVGQTGIAISPNLYLAIGISGAIQHLAGVSNSKVIVVVNKDPEAPFFKAADYGIVGDAFEVLPKLIEAAKAFKSSQN